MMNPQKRDLIAGQRQVWGDAEQLCADCDNTAVPFSCYCEKCENLLAEEAIEANIADRLASKKYGF